MWRDVWGIVEEVGVEMGGERFCDELLVRRLCSERLSVGVEAGVVNMVLKMMVANTLVADSDVDKLMRVLLGYLP